MSRADTVIVLDFETTGLSPNLGDRAIEIGAVRIEGGEITGRFQELMNPGRRIDPFIESYTGISNEMLRDADPCEAVMERFSDFVGDFNLVAHNASFDQRFLDAEMARISRRRFGHFACSMLAARRIFQDAPNHKLGSLVSYAGIPVDGMFHRALYDSEMTVKIWLRMLDTIGDRHGIFDAPFTLMRKLCKTPKRAVDAFLAAGL
ncbi:3'-5' exonuclease [Pelagicoccus sp. SDUM812002]|uniref:3'-5' exonuclease n=1 Tax=Pelagicoccus sp. SDUM812002 TaxID=3041266 RepID=UPI00280F1F6D|nr:3'-5' exonuclease [Pelagicoccus sp. SDUM812002]MDQ8188373.1 3'-5' exonuclease [Pelagicoccus sp. SDUM812002]